MCEHLYQKNTFGVNHGVSLAQNCAPTGSKTTLLHFWAPRFRPDIRGRLPLGFSWGAGGLFLGCCMQLLGCFWAAHGRLLAAPGWFLPSPGLLLGCSGPGLLLGCSWLLLACAWWLSGCSWAAPGGSGAAPGLLLAAPGLLLAAFGCSWAAPGLLLGSFPQSRSNLPPPNTYASLGSSGGLFVWWYLHDAVSDGRDCLLLLVSLLVIWYWEYQLNEEFRQRNGLV